MAAPRRRATPAQSGAERRRRFYLETRAGPAREMRRLHHDLASAVRMGAQILGSNSSGNLTRAVAEAGTVFPGYLSVILPVLMVTLVVVVVAGNALVIMAFVVDKTLRNQSNFFFLNLAISDFLVGELAPFFPLPSHLLSSLIHHLFLAQRASLSLFSFPTLFFFFAFVPPCE